MRKFLLTLLAASACVSSNTDQTLLRTLRNHAYQGIVLLNVDEQTGCAGFRARTMLGTPVGGVVCEDGTVR